MICNRNILLAFMLVFLLGQVVSPLQHTNESDDDEDIHHDNGYYSVDDITPYGYIPCTMAVVLIFLYCIVTRIAYSVDYMLRKKGSTIILENQLGEGKRHLYLMTIETGFWYGSGSSAHTRIEIHARNYCSRIYCLKPNEICKKILQRGSKDIFVLKTADCLGEIYSITMLMLSQTKRTTWYLERIVLFDVSHQRAWIFPCYRWISTFGKPSQIVKLFPSENYSETWVEIFESRWAELHTWVSVFLPYNRLGRFSRIERITCCFNTIFTILFLYMVLVYGLGATFMPKEKKSDYGLLMLRFVVIALALIAVAIVASYAPETILRSSLPIGTTTEHFHRILYENVCMDCTLVERTTDMAIAPNIDPVLNAKHCPLECEICLEDIKKKKMKKQDILEIESPAQLCHDNLFSYRKDSKRATMYYDLANKYLHFFTAWIAFCSKYSTAMNELKSYMDRKKNDDCELKYSKVFHWMLGAMEEVQVKNQLYLKKGIDLSPSECKIPPEPENVLFPLRVGVQDNFRCLSFDNRDTLRLTRVVALLVLVTVMDNLDVFNSVCIKTMHRLNTELATCMYHDIYIMLLALHSLLMDKDQLCIVCNGIIVKTINSLDEFLNDYLKKSNFSDFELLSCVVMKAPSREVKSLEAQTDMDKRSLSNDRCAKRGRSVEAPKRSFGARFVGVRERVSHFAKLIVNDIIKGVVIVNANRKPLHQFFDFMRFRCNSNEPQAWASAALEFTMPLMISIIHPLLKHGCHFMKRTDNFSHHRLIQQYLQTVVVNAAFLAVRDYQLKELDEIWLRDQLEIDQLCNFPQNEPVVDYVCLVDLFKKCLERTEVIKQVLKSNCTEGKLHIHDKQLLLRLLEECKLKANQLACPRTVKMMIELICSFTDRLQSTQKFISQAVLMLTDSQELISEHLENEEAIFVRNFRQQLLDIGFLIMKLLQKCDDTEKALPNHKITFPSTPAYWMRPGYCDMPWVRNVSTYKKFIVNETEDLPFSIAERKVIEALAFGVMESTLSPVWTFMMYLYLLVQSLGFLAFFVAIAPWIEYLEALGALAAIIAGICLEIVIFQPLKIALICTFTYNYYRKRRLALLKKENVDVLD